MSNAVTKTPDSSVAQRDSSRQDLALWPPVDVIEDSTGITLYADLPGVPRDKLNVRVEGDTLGIEAEVALTVPEGMEAHHAEVQLSRYRRAFFNFEGAKLAHAAPAALLRRRGALKNPKKVAALVANAREFERIRAEHGTFGRYLRTMESEKDACAILQERFRHVGPYTAEFYLHCVGVPYMVRERGRLTKRCRRRRINRRSSRQASVARRG